MTVDGTIQRYEDELCHLLTMREDEPLHIPNVEDFFAETGKVLKAEDFYQYFPDSPYNLVVCPPPVVIAAFEWSGLVSDGKQYIDVTFLHHVAQIIKALPYTAWRFRAVFDNGYVQQYYEPPQSPNPQRASQVTSGRNFIQVGVDAWGLDVGNTDGNTPEYHQYDDKFFFTNGKQDIWFPMWFQVELGYGTGTEDPTNIAATWQWPAFTRPILTDEPYWRGYPQFFPNHP